MNRHCPFLITEKNKKFEKVNGDALIQKNIKQSNVVIIGILNREERETT